MSVTLPPRRHVLVSFATAAVVALAFARCGAEGTPAPELPPDQQPPPSECRSLEGYMPSFFALLRDPSLPLAGLREIVIRLNTGTDVRGDPLGAVLTATVDGLKDYTSDPWEVPGGAGEEAQRCWPVTPQNPLPDGLKLCGVEAAAGERCENRMCTIKRAIDFGIRDRAANEALDALRPLVVKVLGYTNNTSPGGDGKEHFELFEVLELTSADAAACPPEQALLAIDRLVTYFRNDASCAVDGKCLGQRAAKVLKELLYDPELQSFLTGYEDANEQAGAGPRKAFITLANVIVDSVVSTPLGEEFASIEQQLNTLVYPFLDRDEKYEGLRRKLGDAVSLVKGLLAPDVGLIQPLKGVLACVSLHDGGRAAAAKKPSGRIVGVLYDLLSRTGQSGIDVKEFADVTERVIALDQEGVLAGAVHAVVVSTMNEPKAMESLRLLLNTVLTVENARLAVPALKVMVEKDILTEIVTVVDNLAFGCRR